jgi:hypothetical protein
MPPWNEDSEVASKLLKRGRLVCASRLLSFLFPFFFFSFSFSLGLLVALAHHGLQAHEKEEQEHVSEPVGEAHLP